MNSLPIAILTAAIWATILVGMGWGQMSIDQLPDDQVPIVMPLVGRTLEQVVAQFGKPYEVFPLRETGGKLLMFENEHHDHYVIETDAFNIVISATVKHPENR